MHLLTHDLDGTGHRSTYNPWSGKIGCVHIALPSDRKPKPCEVRTDRICTSRAVERSQFCFDDAGFGIQKSRIPLDESQKLPGKAGHGSFCHGYPFVSSKSLATSHVREITHGREAIKTSALLQPTASVQDHTGRCSYV
jgi:hypothetical protein